ncbi:aminodeoxychorismate lyase [Paenibacillus allorhizosphaerae]|uniref:Branched-chain-amino-acid aminotransferase n=1 Tax=Paenibacillus allorhizosphaerae TaxID=2849866 RepID=A0ABM8VSF2_9BACL|nr:aminodeoxychorismate lyase [Paenibacillus allorhizosphaerae]CAG7656396.1 Branched-chain-amino-acid aminotransferase [Paenibacillus allorhizosphaerae]
MNIVLNGSMIDEKKAVVSVYDHGFLYGMGLFETFRTYVGQPFLLDAHLKRMTEGCRELDIDFTPDPDKLAAEVSMLLEANALPDGYFRYTVTAGTDILGLPSASYERPTEVLYVKPLPHGGAAQAPTGKAMQRLKLRRNTPEGVVRHKSLHYMNNILAKKELNRYPWAEGAEGLFLDSRGYVCEGIVSNLFFVREGLLLTPSVETGLLPGITRRFVMEQAELLGVRVREGLYTWEELLAAEEIFVTNSIQEMVPVTRLYDEQGISHSIGNGSVGPLTERLLRHYRNMAMQRKGVDIE